MRRALGVLLFMLSLAAPLSSRAAVYALVVQDETPLRPTPGASAKPSTVLWQGEMVEVRGERLDYLQVWDYARERGGFVRAATLKRLALDEDEAPELLAVLRLMRDMPGAEASAQARRIEANGEALARQRLAEAEAYRLQKVGVANSEQMAREGALVTQHPLLIQKTLADKLSDKIQVIIAPPHAEGTYFGSNLIQGQRR